MAIAFEGDVTSSDMPSLLDSGPEVFTARIAVRNGKALVALIGEFDMESAKWLAARLDELAPRPQTYVFDLSQVTFIDSYGGRSLVGRANGAPCFRSPSPIARRFLQRVGLEQFIEDTEPVADLDRPGLEVLFNSFEGL
jgi:anti-anti-sigma factor